MKIHHIGYLVKSIDRARKAFEVLGYKDVQGVVRDGERKVDILFLEMNGSCVELVSPYDPTSVVAGLMTRIGNSPYHICYEVLDLEVEIRRLQDARYVLRGLPAAAPACGGARVCFMMHPHAGIIELKEGRNDD